MTARGAPEDTDRDRLDWLRLARSRNVGPAGFARLLARFGAARAALEALPNLAARAGASYGLPWDEARAMEEMETAARLGARMLRRGAPDYPARLAEIADAPPILWALGPGPAGPEGAVAVIGARNASSLGLRLARRLTRDLAEGGRAVVSGLARGIDAAAHEAALETGTVAVLAGGVDVIYPKENARLYDAIRERGAILSEAPIGLQPLGRHFPRRNRIVSGLAEGVVLIEAAARSGSLITARCALEQGREVMAVPGSPLDPRAEGCNQLIREGAALIRDAADVEEALAAPRSLALKPGATAFREDALPLPDPPAHDERPPDDLAARAAQLIGPEAVDMDRLARDLGADPATFAALLQEMELDGLVERRPGGLVALAPRA